MTREMRYGGGGSAASYSRGCACIHIYIYITYIYVTDQLECMSFVRTLYIFLLENMLLHVRIRISVRILHTKG